MIAYDQATPSSVLRPAINVMSGHGSINGLPIIKFSADIFSERFHA